MSVDLTLLPYGYGGWVTDEMDWSHDALQVFEARDLWDKIKALDANLVEPDFHSYVSRDSKYEESHYGNTTEDPYGNKVKWVHAKDLKPLLIGPPGAFINALKDDHKVALFWS